MVDQCSDTWHHSAYWLDFGFTQMDNQVSWRFPIALQALFAAISFVMMLMLPDTPRCAYHKSYSSFEDLLLILLFVLGYYSMGRIEEGDRVLAALHGQSMDSEPVQRQKHEILDTIALEDTHAKINLLDIFWDRSRLKTGRRLRISFLILAIQQNMGQAPQVSSKCIL